MSVPQQQAARKNSKKEIDNLKREVELWKDKFKWLQEDHELLQLDMALLETHPHVWSFRLNFTSIIDFLETTANEPVFQADVENLSTVEPIHTQNDSSMIPQKRAAQEPANKVRVVLATEGQAKGLIDRLNDKNHTLREELTKLQNSSVEMAAVCINQSEKQCDDLEEDLALAESMLSECQSRLQNANCQVARSQQELDECELKAQQGHSADIAELQAQLGRINKLIADNDELKAEKERLASEKATQASEISQLKEAAELLQANLKQAHSVVVTVAALSPSCDIF
ncbi:hypothetical protein C8R43DRAFT_955745 [Mycena crocata]|nr:hypothetical protein C8R43DRAFT_955738 [Mycena crocata]KAJ7136521.1 hypothetical protein C8R43DRAFT_955745 [Mycena crocata]